MINWFISDTHFYHDRIIEFSKRPFKNIKEMNEQLVTNWNSKVEFYDKVYHVGDFALGNVADDMLLELCKALSGEVHIIPGNHDTLRKLKVYEEAKFIIEPPLLHLKKLHLTLCHFPLVSWYNSSHGSYHIHGHTHGALQNENAKMRRYDAGVDVNEFYPVDYDSILLQLKNRDYYHHHTHEVVHVEQTPQHS